MNCSDINTRALDFTMQAWAQQCCRRLVNLVWFFKKHIDSSKLKNYNVIKIRK